MKYTTVLLFAMCALLTAPASHAGGGGHHGGHHAFHHGLHGGLFFGYAPRWDPYYYYPRRIVTRVAEPIVYVQKSDQQKAYYWYYCPDPEGYYPYVKQCPLGWMQVVPRASPPPP